MNSYDYLESKYPLYYKTCLYLQDSFLYRDFLKNQEQIPVSYEISERICSDAFKMCGSDWGEYTKKLQILLEVDVEFLKLQASLEKNGKYLYSSFKEVKKEVFEKKERSGSEGVEYLWAVFFSNIFWITHCRVFNFFREDFIDTADQIGTCLEAPTGSGIFLNYFLLENDEWTGKSVDLGDTSISFAKNLAKIHNLSDKIIFSKQDLNEYKTEEKFDRIICVEFVEHVEDPVLILKKLRSLLKLDGKMFFTTVAWAAFVDHIYLYKNIEEIRQHLYESGFSIEKEYIQNIFPKDKDKLTESNIALNFAAIVVPTS